MSNMGKDEMNDWIADHDDEVIGAYLEGLTDTDWVDIVLEMIETHKDLKALLYEHIASSKHMDKAQEEYLTTMENEGPEREDYGGDR